MYITMTFDARRHTNTQQVFLTEYNYYCKLACNPRVLGSKSYISRPRAISSRHTYLVPVYGSWKFNTYVWQRRHIHQLLLHCCAGTAGCDVHTQDLVSQHHVILGILSPTETPTLLPHTNMCCVLQRRAQMYVYRNLLESQSRFGDKLHVV